MSLVGIVIEQTKNVYCNKKEKKETHIVETHMKICGARWHLFSYKLLGYSTFRLLGYMELSALITEHNRWEERKWGQGIASECT